VLRFIGHVTDDNGQILFIVNTVQDAQLAAERASAEGITPFLYTSLGVHDDQLLPEEFFAV
jgi:hypothetical protein